MIVVMIAEINVYSYSSNEHIFPIKPESKILIKIIPGRKLITKDEQQS